MWYADLWEFTANLRQLGMHCSQALQDMLALSEVAHITVIVWVARQLPTCSMEHEFFFKIEYTGACICAKLRDRFICMLQHLRSFRRSWLTEFGRNSNQDIIRRSSMIPTQQFLIQMQHKRNTAPYIAGFRARPCVYWNSDILNSERLHARLTVHCN